MPFKYFLFCLFLYGGMGAISVGLLIAGIVDFWKGVLILLAGIVLFALAFLFTASDEEIEELNRSRK